MSKKTASVFVRPFVSEKTAYLSGRDVAVFEVAGNATKVDVRNAFKALYGVIPQRVNIVNTRGKQVVFGRRFGRRSDVKKAYIYLPKGSKIDIFDGV